MNMSHYISHFSFGRVIAPHEMSDVKRLIPYLGRSHDRLNGIEFINYPEIGANATVSFSLEIVKSLSHWSTCTFWSFWIMQIEHYLLWSIIYIWLQIEHYLQVVKSEVIITKKSSGNHKLMEEYEYTAHSSFVQSPSVPVAKFHFVLSPMQVLATIIVFLDFFFLLR